MSATGCAGGRLGLVLVLLLVAPVLHAQDADGDGLDDAVELRIGSNPAAVDSDGDLQDDWDEFYRCRNPLDSADSGGLRCALSAGDDDTPADFAWSESGPLAGMHCVRVVPATDADAWANTYFCMRPFLGMAWSNSGPISGMSCLLWREGNDPAWNNNNHFLCFESSGPSPAMTADSIFSTAGTIPGEPCIAISNAAKPGAGWDNNHFCYKSTAVAVESIACNNCGVADLANGAVLQLQGRDPLGQSAPISAATLAGENCAPVQGSPGQCRLPAGSFANLGRRHLLQTSRSRVAFDFPAPVLDSVMPSTLPAAGGQLVLQGSFFGVGQPRVLVGGAACTVSAQSPTQLSCLAPARGPGATTVLVEVGNQASSPRLLNYLPPTPVVNGVGVVGAAPTSGGGLLRVLGNHLDQNPQVLVNLVACNVLGFSSTAIDCLMPAGRGAGVAVVISAGGQTFDAEVDYDDPLLGGFQSEGGPTAGQVLVTLQGSNFGSETSGVVVSFGDANCLLGPPGTSVGHSAITCRLPAGQGASVPVQVQVLNQQSNVRGYRYAAPQLDPPVLNLLGTAGGERLVLTGSHFGSSGSVRIGGEPCDIDVYGDSRIECLTPPGSGAIRPLLLDVSGQIASSSVAYRPPQLDPLTSTLVGPTAGLSSLQLRGQNLGGPSLALPRSVRIGQADCDITAADHDQVTCTLPEGEGAALPLSIVVDGQASNTLGFTYLAPRVDRVSPGTGPTAGGIVVRVDGDNFGLDPLVVVGGSLCTRGGRPFGHDFVECLLPPGAAGGSTLAVVAAGQSSGPQPFTYDSDPKLLLLRKLGAGDGDIVSLPAGLDCAPGCRSRDNLFPAGSTLALRATASPRSRFEGWQGACVHSGPECVIVLGDDAAVDAEFSSPDAVFSDGFESPPAP
jgi:hypothetical protein